VLSTKVQKSRPYRVDPNDGVFAFGERDMGPLCNLGKHRKAKHTVYTLMMELLRYAFPIFALWLHVTFEYQEKINRRVNCTEKHSAPWEPFIVVLRIFEVLILTLEMT